MRVLVLGAYGLIGASVTRHLQADGHHVVGLGRNRGAARRVFPTLEWCFADLRDLMEPSDWAEHLGGIDAVVNCAGALQDGGDDDLNAVHRDMLRALGRAAAERDIGVVQISAAGVSSTASTAFFRSKAEGDAALLASGAKAWILRPGLVIDRSAYGGTALLRMLAAVPWGQPMAMGDTPVQCIGADDLARAVAHALVGDLPHGEAIDLVEGTPRPLREVIAAHRAWLGFAPARFDVPFPQTLLPLVGKFADALGRLGWRSPLRTTALTVLREGITGDPTRYRAQGGEVSPLQDVLAQTSLGSAHRLQARLSLLMPLVLVGLSLFWILSGVMGVISLTPAAQVLLDIGWSPLMAKLAVLFWAVVDMVIGVAVLWRRHAPRACLAMIAVSLVYLLSASLLTPALWLDPLGPLVKVIPVILAALLLRVMLEDR